MAVFEISRALLVIPGTGPLLLMLPQGGGREMTYHDNLIRSQTERIKVVFLVLMTMAALSGCTARIHPRGRLEFPMETMANGSKIRIK